jgi:Uma2 family endonuclease
VRSPDAAFVLAARWEVLTSTKQKKFPPVCPDFIIELNSDSDSVADLRKKILEDWLPNGCQLASFIDADEKKAYIFRPNTPEAEHFSIPIPLNDALLPYFALDLTAS